MKYVCPFCYKTMPEGYELSGWSCCGKVGHATILPECPKCGAESLELPLAHCAVCGWKSEEYLRRRDCLPRTTEPELCAHPLSEGEKAKLLLRLDDLLRFLGSPGDWGYHSKLGVMTQRLLELRRDI